MVDLKDKESIKKLAQTLENDINVLDKAYMLKGCSILDHLKMAADVLNKLADKPRDAEKEFIASVLMEEDKTLICLAYTYAKNVLKYGTDVTEAWTTAAEQDEELRNAYNQGYLEGLKEQKGFFTV